MDLNRTSCLLKNSFSQNVFPFFFYFLLSFIPKRQIPSVDLEKRRWKGIASRSKRHACGPLAHYHKLVEMEAQCIAVVVGKKERNGGMKRSKSEKENLQLGWEKKRRRIADHALGSSSSSRPHDVMDWRWWRVYPSHFYTFEYFWF